MTRAKIRSTSLDLRQGLAFLKYGLAMLMVMTAVGCQVQAQAQPVTFTQMWKGQEMWQFGDGNGKVEGTNNWETDPEGWKTMPGQLVGFRYSGTGALPAPAELVIPLGRTLPAGRYRLFVKNFYRGKMEATLGDVTKPLEIVRYDWTPGVIFETKQPADRIVLRYFPTELVADNGQAQEQYYTVHGAFLTTEMNKVPIKAGEIVDAAAVGQPEATAPAAAEQPKAVVPAAAGPLKAMVPAREKFHLYLLIGQSNMAGRGDLDEEAKIAPPRVLTFTKDQTWAPAVDPLDVRDDGGFAGVGPGIAFAKMMAEKDPDITIGLIPCAFGGSNLDRWEKGRNLYVPAVQRALAAMKEGTLKGILWHQGESNAVDQQNAADYGQRLATMFGALREELRAGDVPIVVGELGTFLSDKDFPYAAPINAALSGIPQAVPLSAFVTSKGLKDKGDSLHFDTASARELGRRYAAAMIELQKKARDAR